jgi:hypothetical protein
MKGDLECGRWYVWKLEAKVLEIRVMSHWSSLDLCVLDSLILKNIYFLGPWYRKSDVPDVSEMLEIFAIWNGLKSKISPHSIILYS